MSATYITETEVDKIKEIIHAIDQLQISSLRLEIADAFKDYAAFSKATEICYSDGLEKDSAVEAAWAKEIAKTYLEKIYTLLEEKIGQLEPLKLQEIIKHNLELLKAILEKLKEIETDHSNADLVCLELGQQVNSPYRSTLALVRAYHNPDTSEHDKKFILKTVKKWWNLFRRL